MGKMEVKFRSNKSNPSFHRKGSLGLIDSEMVVHCCTVYRLSKTLPSNNMILFSTVYIDIRNKIEIESTCFWLYLVDCLNLGTTNTSDLFG